MNLTVDSGSGLEVAIAHLGLAAEYVTAGRCRAAIGLAVVMPAQNVGLHDHIVVILVVIFLIFVFVIPRQNDRRSVLHHARGLTGLTTANPILELIQRHLHHVGNVSPSRTVAIEVGFHRSVYVWVTKHNLAFIKLTKTADFSLVNDIGCVSLRTVTYARSYKNIAVVTIGL